MKIGQWISSWVLNRKSRRQRDWNEWRRFGETIFIQAVYWCRIWCINLITYIMFNVGNNSKTVNFQEWISYAPGTERIQSISWFGNWKGASSLLILWDHLQRLRNNWSVTSMSRWRRRLFLSTFDWENCLELEMSKQWRSIIVVSFSHNLLCWFSANLTTRCWNFFIRS
jgi:hypothetical protein